MHMALNGKRKLGFVDGSIPRPDADAEPELLSAWQCINDIVSSWLLNSVSKDIVAGIVYADFAASIWSDLRDRFSQGNGPHIFQLKKELIGLSQGSLSVT